MIRHKSFTTAERHYVAVIISTEPTNMSDAPKKAIQAHQAVNDKFPQDLEEVKSRLSAPDLDLSKYTYNASDGSVTIKK